MQLVKYFRQLPKEQAQAQDMLHLPTLFLKPLSHSMSVAAWLLHKFLNQGSSGSPFDGSYDQGWIKTWRCHKSVKSLKCHIITISFVRTRDLVNPSGFFSLKAVHYYIACPELNMMHDGLCLQTNKSYKFWRHPKSFN